VRVLLLGHPVDHSLSPVMQNAAFKALRREDVYETVDVPPGRLEDYLTMLRESPPYLGANVTVPYKVDAAGAIDELDRDAQVLGAVNTIVTRDGRLKGYNTDVHGAWEGLLGKVRDSLLASRILILGAGGGARAVVAALSRSLVARPAVVVVAARRAEARADLLAVAEDVGIRATSVPWSQLASAAGSSDILVNATPLGLRGEDDPLAGIALGGKVVLDLAYRPGGTPLFRRAWREGALALQGDEMLLHQGAAAFTLWTGQDAPIDAMRKALAAALDHATSSRDR